MQRISRNEVKDLIEPFFNEVLLQEYLDIQSLDSNHLLTWDRFDLAAKLLYLEDLRNHRCVNLELYKEHIRLLTLGKYQEPGNENKNSIEKFKQVFNNLYFDFINKGFDDQISLIPVCKTGSILNGAHRVACAIDLKKKVKTITLDVPSQELDYKFFRERGASVDFLDRCANQFVKHSLNTYIAIIWPAAIGKHKEIEGILENIVYYKELNLSIHGLHNLVCEIYQDEEWLGDRKQNYEGALGKTIPCFYKDQPTRVYAFQSENSDVLIKKGKIRKLFGIGKHSIHINDVHEQSLYIANLLFNINCEHFLNNGYPNKYIETINKFDSFLEFCKDNSINKDRIILDGGIVLSLYGLRKCDDIDYITDNEINDNKVLRHEINSHKKEIIYHGVSIEDLLYNGSFHFYYRGIKVISLQQIGKMKETRGESKDLIDLSLIRTINNKKSFKFILLKLINRFLFIKVRLFYLLINILIFFRIYNFVRFFYRKARKLL
jgi:hypothetical protein